MPATVDTGSRVSGVTWYEVHTMRKADGKGTLVSFTFVCLLIDDCGTAVCVGLHHLWVCLPQDA